MAHCRPVTVDLRRVSTQRVQPDLEDVVPIRSVALKNVLYHIRNGCGRPVAVNASTLAAIVAVIGNQNVCKTAAADLTTANMVRLIYYSRHYQSSIELSVREMMEDIVGSSAIKNRCLGITGLLIYTRELFAQVLEGPEHALRRLFVTIAQDKRHHDVRVITDFERIPHRQFGEAAMESIIVDDNDPALLLFSMSVFPPFGSMNCNAILSLMQYASRDRSKGQSLNTLSP